jgi:hypothetical protein
MTLPGSLRLAMAAAGVLLIVSLFLSWAGDASGWELLAIGDVFLLIVALLALLTAITGGRIGVFRPDASLTGATDLFSVAATLMLLWLLVFDFPDGADRGVGVFLALVASFGIAAAAGDYRVMRGAPLFPRLDD